MLYWLCMYCMGVYVYVCEYVCMYMCVHVCICMYICMCVYVHVSVCLYACAACMHMLPFIVRIHCVLLCFFFPVWWQRVRASLWLCLWSLALFFRRWWAAFWALYWRPVRSMWLKCFPAKKKVCVKGDKQLNRSPTSLCVRGLNREMLFVDVACYCRCWPCPGRRQLRLLPLHFGRTCSGTWVGVCGMAKCLLNGQ